MSDGFFESTQVRETDVAAMLSDFKDAAFSHAGGAASAIKAIFLSPFEAMQLFGAEVESSAPVAVCKTTDVSTAIHGDTLVINSITYYIRGVEHDGTGTTVLVLSRD